MGRIKKMTGIIIKISDFPALAKRRFFSLFLASCAL
jgi:hypothetical protein